MHSFGESERPLNQGTTGREEVKPEMFANIQMVPEDQQISLQKLMFVSLPALPPETDYKEFSNKQILSDL